MAKIIIAELDINTDSLVKSANATTEAITKMAVKQFKLKASTEELRSEIRKVGGATAKNKQKLEQQEQQIIKNDVATKKLKTTYREQTKIIGLLNLETDKRFNLLSHTTTLIEKNTRSIDGARNNNKKLLLIRNKLNLSSKEGQKQLTLINAKLDKNNQFIKQNSDALSKQKINIGNYGSAVSGLSPQLARISAVLVQVKNGLLASGVAMKTSAVATGGMSKALRIFRLALISTGIGALLVALGSLVTFLSSTQKGIDLVTKVTRPLKAIFGALQGVAERVGEVLFSIFSNPKQAVADLWTAIKTNLLNRISGIADVFGALGKVIKATFKLDFDTAKEGLAELGESITQTITGVDNLPDKIRASAKATGEFFSEAIDKGKEIDRLQKSIEQGEADIILTRAKTRLQLRELQLIANDRSLSLEKNNEASNQALVLANKLSDAEKSILNDKISQELIQQSLNDSGRKDLAKLNELRAERLQADEKARATELKFLTAKSAFNKKQIVEAKKIVTQAIKNQKTLLNIFIAEQGIKAKSFAEEIEFAEQVSKKKLDILEAELDAKKITQEQFNLAVLQLDNDLLLLRSDIAVEQAERELEIFISGHQSKLDANLFFTEELLQQEQDRLDAMAEKEREFQALRLEQGVINQQQFNDAINQVDEDNRIAKAELQVERDDAIAEKDIIDLENRRIIEEENFLTNFEIASGRLELQRQQEIKDAKDTDADIDLINEKFRKRQEGLDKAVQLNKLQVASQTFGQLADLLGENTALGKVAGIAKATIDTFVGADLALATLPPPFGAIQAGITIATGLGNVAKIAGISTSFYEGGQVPELESGRITIAQNIPIQEGGDNVLVTVKRGEVILNQTQQQRAGGDAFFRSIGVPSFATGGTFGVDSITNQTVNNTVGIDFESLGDIIAEKINDVKIVAIESEITNAQISQVEIEDGARF